MQQISKRDQNFYRCALQRKNERKDIRLDRITQFPINLLFYFNNLNNLNFEHHG